MKLLGTIGRMSVLVSVAAVLAACGGTGGDGTAPVPGTSRLDVTVVEEVDQVRVVVSNDLPPAGRKPAAGHQVGLASARERIEALSEGRGRLETRVLDGRYVATITLPVG